MGWRKLQIILSFSCAGQKEKLTVTYLQIMRAPRQSLIMLALWSWTSASRPVRNCCLFFPEWSSLVQCGRRAMPSRAKRHRWEERAVYTLLHVPFLVALITGWGGGCLSFSPPKYKPLAGSSFLHLAHLFVARESRASYPVTDQDVPYKGTMCCSHVERMDSEKALLKSYTPSQNSLKLFYKVIFREAKAG